MSDCAISPMFFYWIEFFDKIRILLIAAFIVIVLSYVAVVIWYGDDFLDKMLSEQEKKRFISNIKRLSILTAFIIGLMIFVPSDETLISMEIAKYTQRKDASKIIEAIQFATQMIMEVMSK